MTGVPSASIAIVRANEIVYERAYEDGRIDPKTPASPSMRYAIGSVSKQFTATAVLHRGFIGQDPRCAPTPWSRS